MQQTWSTEDIPDLAGRTAIVTGANTGLGAVVARELSHRGARVVLACRDVAKGADVAADLAGAQVVRLDLTSLESVREAAAEIRDGRERIDLLINNAGVMMTPRGVTRDGFELQLGTNHLGHFALTGLLLDRVLAAPGSRVVTVSSLAHRLGSGRLNFEDLHSEQAYDRMGAYAQSKLANLLFTHELQRRLAAADSSTVAVAAHPGISSTDLGRHVPWYARPLVAGFTLVAGHNAEKGALPTLRAATDPELVGGDYVGPSGYRQMRGAPAKVSSSRASSDPEAALRLWEISEELTGVRPRIEAE